MATRLTAVAVAVSIVTACSASESGDSAHGVDSATVLQELVSAPEDGSVSDTLRIAHLVETPSMDPVLSTVYGGYLLYPVYDTLFGLDEQGDPAPWLVQSWSQPDPLTYRLELKEDVIFHDGSAFDAEAVALNLERAKATVGSPNSQVYSVIDRVDIESRYVAVVRLNTPAPEFATNMASIAGMMVSPEAIRTGVDLTRSTAGSGGWMWDGDRHEENVVHYYTANHDYWNPGVVDTEEIEIRIVTDGTARTNAVTTGQVEMATNVPADQAVTLPGTGPKLVTDQSTVATLMLLDRAGAIAPALADVRVRQAIGLLIDREGFNRVVLSGLGDSVPGGFAAQGSRWYYDELNERVQFDAERARALLREAGYADGFTLDIPSTAVIKPYIEALGQMLAIGNIDVNIVELQASQYTAELRRGAFPAAYMPITSTDIDRWWSGFMSNSSSYNPFGLDDLADLETKYRDSLEHSEPSNRTATTDVLQGSIIERGVAFPLSTGPRIVVLSANLHADEYPVVAPEDPGLRPFDLRVEQ
jgi:peptide/nickel transport system substrate-binding protein